MTWRVRRPWRSGSSTSPEWTPTSGTWSPTTSTSNQQRESGNEVIPVGMREQWQHFRVGQQVVYGRQVREIVAIVGNLVRFKNQDGTEVLVSFNGYGPRIAG